MSIEQTSLLFIWVWRRENLSVGTVTAAVQHHNQHIGRGEIMHIDKRVVSRSCQHHTGPAVVASSVLKI